MLNKNLLFAVLIAAYSAQVVAVEELMSQEDFNNKVTGSKGLVVVDFYMVRCGPCKMLAPEFENIASSPEHSDVKFYKIDSSISEPAGISQKLGVRGYPSVFFFKDGSKVDLSIGNAPDVIRSKINQHKSGTKKAMVKKTRAPIEEDIMDEEEVVVARQPVIKQEVRQPRRQASASRGSRGRSRSSCRSCR